VNLEELVATMPFARELGIVLTRADRDGVEGTMRWAAERCTAGNLLHGGAIMALADSLGGICAFLNLPAGAGTSTIESKTNFMRGVTEGIMSAVTQPIHVGRRTIVIQTHVRDHDGKLVALTIQTQAVLT
jgi:1,4-dihydroxy-2-naphthoyl-CoA hydrolase